MNNKMKRIKEILSFVFILGIMCLGFSFALNNYGYVNAFAYSSQIVLEDSTFDMAGGTVSNAVGDNGGAVYVGEGATFTMTGGKIKNCTATNGGAVYIANGGTFVFEGGTIENCSADLGYAVYVQEGGTFNYENNPDGFIDCGEDQDLHIYAEEGAIVITPGTYINIYVDDATTPAKTMKKTGDTYTIDEEEMPLDYENCCGYFLDEELTKTIKNDIVDLSNGDVNIYTRTASDADTYFIFTENTTTATYDIKAKDTTISGNIVFPKEYNNVQTSIFESSNYNQGAFHDCVGITSITFASGFLNTGYYSFFQCSGIESVVFLPDSMTKISEGSFASCSNLPEVVVPESVTIIGGSSLQYCPNLKKCDLPEGLTEIGYGTFMNSGIEDIVIPDGVTEIESSVFSGCLNLEKVVLGSGVTYIGRGAFLGCSALSYVDINSSVHLVSNVFSGTGLTTLWLPAGCTAPASQPFDGMNLILYTEDSSSTFQISGSSLSGITNVVYDTTKAEYLQIISNASAEFVRDKDEGSISFNNELKIGKYVILNKKEYVAILKENKKAA